MNDGERYIRTVRFESPDRIPMVYHINPSCWQHYDQDALQDLQEAHPLLFPDFVRKATPFVPEFSPVATAGVPYTDAWGCVWQTSDSGITGVVTEHPLADWSAFETYTPPDLEKTNGCLPFDWDDYAKRVAEARETGHIPHGALVHGHTFLQLIDIRGYENLLMDMADEEPRLWQLIEMIEQFNLQVLRRYVSLGVGIIGIPEDLGMQVGPMLSPAHFRTYIKPSYQKYMQVARDAGCMIHMHSDGDIRTLIDDLIDAGVEIINLQDLVNGVDWIAERLAGKHCIDLDIDRQQIVRFGSPADIDQHIRYVVERLGSPKGGLMLKHGLYPGIPMDNIKATMDAMERYSTYYS